MRAVTILVLFPTAVILAFALPASVTIAALVVATVGGRIHTTHVLASRRGKSPRCSSTEGLHGNYTNKEIPMTDTSVATKHDMTTEETEAVRRWCVEMATLHAEHAQPLDLFIDPRVMEMFRVEPRLLDHSAGPQDLADRYFEHCVSLPAWPLPAPEWATETVIQTSLYPQVEIVHRGKAWESGDHSARLEQVVSVYVESHEYRDGVAAVGVFHDSGALVDFGGADMCGYDDTNNLRTVLNNVLDQLAPYEKVAA